MSDAPLSSKPRVADDYKTWGSAALREHAAELQNLTAEQRDRIELLEARVDVLSRPADEPTPALSATRFAELLSKCIFHAETGDDETAAFYGDLVTVLQRASVPPSAGLHPNCTDPCGVCDHRDAERWRALIGCARVRVLGSAGLQERVGTTGYAHIGVEFWTHHEAASHPEAIERLTQFADRAAVTKSEVAP